MLASVSNLQKKILAGTPEGVGKVCLKFPASAGRLAIVWETSLPALAGKLQTHFSNPFWGPSKKFFFGGCSQRLTLKDFTIGSCIRDILLHMSYAIIQGDSESELGARVRCWDPAPG